MQGENNISWLCALIHQQRIQPRPQFTTSRQSIHVNRNRNVQGEDVVEAVSNRRLRQSGPARLRIVQAGDRKPRIDPMQQSRDTRHLRDLRCLGRAAGRHRRCRLRSRMSLCRTACPTYAKQHKRNGPEWSWSQNRELSPRARDLLPLKHFAEVTRLKRDECGPGSKDPGHAIKAPVSVRPAARKETDTVAPCSRHADESGGCRRAVRLHERPIRQSVRSQK